jgi:glutamate formiminotransferase / formiminotetrahydrofolate cyclodeaminase
LSKILECVPNFSEGRRKEVVDLLAKALTSVPGVALLDSEMDPDHNRCVISVAGPPEAVAAGVVTAVGTAIELIDLRQHQGEHPRMGATDVIPFVPITGIAMEEAVELSVKVARDIAERYSLPVYLYEQSARIAERRDLAFIRKGEFEGIRDEIGTRPERKPDFGPDRVHPSAGVTAVGARHPLIAYNVYLHSSDLEIAQAIARAVRFSSGGLRFVKALGFEIKDRNQVQVSMNLTDYEATPIFRAFDMVRHEAARFGISVASSEIVGLVPQRALDACAGYYLRLEKFSPEQILENRLADALTREPSVEEFLNAVASRSPAPGGGSAAALAATLAAALGEMVCALTEGRKKYAGVEPQIVALHQDLSRLRASLQRLIREDSKAYTAVVDALKLPSATEEEKAARMRAVESATRYATEVPLQVARDSRETLLHLRNLAPIGNQNARSDASAAAQLAFAALKGAQYNVIINTTDLNDRAFSQQCREEVSRMAVESMCFLSEIDRFMLGDHSG